MIKIASEVNNNLNGDGCSIFLLDPISGKNILRESTLLTEHIDVLNINYKEKLKIIDVVVTGLVRVK